MFSDDCNRITGHLQVDLRSEQAWIIENIADKYAHLFLLERMILQDTGFRKLLGHESPLHSPIFAIRQKNELIVKPAAVTWITDSSLHIQRADAQMSHLLLKD
jgi:hypothetical protein